jgi:hypothetical protein
VLLGTVGTCQHFMVTLVPRGAASTSVLRYQSTYLSARDEKYFLIRPSLLFLVVKISYRNRRNVYVQ